MRERDRERKRESKDTKARKIRLLVVKKKRTFRHLDLGGE